MDRRDFRHRLGARIRAARLQAGLSQEALAEKLELSRPAVASIESGRQGLLVDQLIAIATVLDVPYKELIPGNAPEETQSIPGLEDLADRYEHWRREARAKKGGTHGKT